MYKKLIMLVRGDFIFVKNIKDSMCTVLEYIVLWYRNQPTVGGVTQQRWTFILLIIWHSWSERIISTCFTCKSAWRKSISVFHFLRCHICGDLNERSASCPRQFDNSCSKSRAIVWILTGWQWKPHKYISVKGLALSTCQTQQHVLCT